MEKNTILIALMLVVGLVVGYQVGQGGSYPGPGSHMMRNGSVMGRNIDQHFIVEMIPHHEGAIAMAELALERSKRPEILSLSQGIIEAQQREIDDMRRWYQDWFDSTVPATESTMGGGMMHMGSLSGDIDDLQSATDFDREFIRQMVPHHEMAIMMANMLQVSTERDEMKQLADNIITSQSREIEMMRGWLDAWY